MMFACNFFCSWLQVQGLIDSGFACFVVVMEKMEWYWMNMLQDYVDHPAGSHPDQAFPMTMYGSWSE